MDILEKLFGGADKLKIIRLFLLNPNVIFERPEISKRSKVDSKNLSRELNMLEGIGFIKKKNSVQDVHDKDGKSKKKKINGYSVNESFKYLPSLRSLIVSSEPLQDNKIVARINKIGKIKLIVASGVFMHDEDSRIDLLVVGDEIRERTLENTMSIIESEIGKELRYTVLNTIDFKYRMGIYDRLIRDIFEYPHQIVIDKVGITK